MASITGADYNKPANRTPIVNPGDAALQGNVTVTLSVPPIGQPIFVLHQDVLVARIYGGGTQNMQGTINRVDGPSKYGIANLH